MPETHPSPSFLVDLCAIILHFRKHQFGLSTDIEKAFLHITLTKKTGILHVLFGCQTHWTPSANFLSTDLSEYCLVQYKLTLYYCMIIIWNCCKCCKWCIVIIHHHCLVTFKCNLYVDNIVSGCETEQQGIQYFWRSKIHDVLCWIQPEGLGV